MFLFHLLNLINGMLFIISALVVRFLTKRFIGEYASGTGNYSTLYYFINIC